MLPPPRRVTLVLCTDGGELLGALPPYDVAVPWWQDAAAVVAGAHATYGVGVTVLRLLRVGATNDGHRDVTYLAELSGAPDGLPLTACADDPLTDHPLRLPYARPGGPAADLAWARSRLAELEQTVTAAPVQERTWNLSSIWRLPTTTGAAWLKVVPPFFAHEGRMLSSLEPGIVPTLLAAEGGRVLLDDVPGTDQHEAPLSRLVRMVQMLVRLQAGWTGRVDQLEDLGLPDWRAKPFGVAAAHALDESADALDPATRRRVESLVAGLGDRFPAVEAAGVPDTLVHGDFHPGNVRGTDRRLVLLDWGDCGIGNPLLDQAAFLERLSAADAAVVQQMWAAEWCTRVPGCDPERAAALLAPVAALRQAVSYQTILEGIEPDERVYHHRDPALWLERAAALA